jgi:hypothetical protein
MHALRAADSLQLFAAFINSQQDSLDHQRILTLICALH